MGGRLWKVVVYLSGVWDGFQLLASSLQRLGDEVGGALLTHAEHHAAAHIKCVPISVEDAGAAAWDDVPVKQATCGFP